MIKLREEGENNAGNLIKSSSDKFSIMRMLELGR
jgi:hypothetical protein